MAGIGGSSKGPIDQSTFRFGAPGAPQVTGGNPTAPYASYTTDAQRTAMGGDPNWGKTTAQITGYEPVRAFWGELQPGQADGSGGIPAGATPSYNPASGKVEWMSLAQNQTPAKSDSGSSMQGLMAAGAGGGGSAPSGGGGDFASGPMSSDPGDGAPGGGSGGPGGAKVVDPASNNASMQGLMSAGGGDSGAPGANMLTGPTHFRNGIGSRMIPNQQSPLAGNRRIY